MLAAARRRFLQESYENVGLRDIAGDAGVDVALVSRYFGSKEALFLEVLRGHRGRWVDPTVQAVDLPGWLAALAMSDDPDGGRDDIERLLIILRSVSSPKAAELVRNSFRDDVLDPIAALIEGPEAEMRASLALSILIGTTFMRTIMSVEPLHRCDRPAIRSKIFELLKTVLAPD